MNMDTLIYAVIAIVVLARLWSSFGQRNDEDRQRPNPFVAPPSPDSKPSSPIVAAPDGNPEMLPIMRPLLSAPDSLAGGLEQIRFLDQSFDEKAFLQGAKAAFTMILEDFAKGDMARIATMLSPQVAARFRDSIEARRQAGQVMDNKLVRIKDTETAAAKVDGTTAILTVRFVSDQICTLRDSTGVPIGGADDGRAEEVIDLWTFSRDTKSPDPNWALVETKT